MTPDALDLVLALAFVVAYPLHGYLTYPSFIRQAQSGTPGVRVSAYVETLAIQWVLTLLLVGRWVWAQRPLSWLGLVPGPEASIVVVVVALIGIVAWWHVRSVRAVSDADLSSAYASLGDVRYFLPHNLREGRIFWAVSATAGCCEEIWFRGLLPWLLSAYMDPVLAWASSTAIFGLAHAYQGAAGILKTGVIGLVMVGVTLWAGTIWPAILLHTIVDLHGGAVGRQIVEAAHRENAASTAG